jgi:hypothetical protein
LLGQGDTQAAACGFQGDTGARDAAADYEQIERL